MTFPIIQAHTYGCADPCSAGTLSASAVTEGLAEREPGTALPAPKDGHRQLPKSKTLSLRSLYTAGPHKVQQLSEVEPKASVQAKMLISYGAFPPPDALAEDSGQLAASQGGRFGHLVGSCIGFLRGVSKDALISPKGY